MSLIISKIIKNSTLQIANNFSNTFNFSDIDNDYLQQQIYSEVKRNNSSIELWHHFLGVFGSLISLFGIFGNN
jgi:hypothetical protein